MVLFTSKKSICLAGAALALMLAGATHAQPGTTAPSPASQSVSPTSTPTSTKSVAHPPAFEGYKPYADVPVGNWKAANDTVAQIGGWRAYAKQAQQLDNLPTPAAKAVEITPKPITKAKP